MAAELLQFPERGRVYSPTELYRQMHPLFSFPRNTIYIGAPVTSGLAYRIIDEPAAHIPQVIELNRRLMVGLVNGIAQAAPHTFENIARSTGPSVVLPHTIEGRLGNRELDINMFWTGFLTGVDSERFEVFSQEVQAGKVVALDVFNNHGASRERRWQEYERLAKMFFDFVTVTQTAENRVNPVSGIVFGPDRQQSLGCSLERLVGSLFGVPQFEMQFNTKHPLFGFVLRDFVLLRDECLARGSPFELPFFEDDASPDLIRAIQLSLGQ